MDQEGGEDIGYWYGPPRDAVGHSSDPDHINTHKKINLILPSLSFPQQVMDRV